MTENLKPDHNSTTNQSIKGKFVEREIIALFSYPMQDLIEKEIISYDDMDLYEYPEYNGDFAEFEGGNQEARDEEIERLQELISELEEQIGDEDNMLTDDLKQVIQDKVDKIQEEIEELEQLDTEPKEIYEWWLVTSWMANKLEEQGQTVTEWHNLHIWGRETTGQAILLDGVISRICSEMGILDGQEHSWAEKK